LSRLRKFWSSTRREKQLLGEAGMLLLLSTVCVKTLPFKRIYNFLHACYRESQSSFGEKYDHGIEIKLIDVSISRAANGLPWRNLCLSRSIAKFVMLRRRGIPATLVAGARILEDSSLAAHAWVNIGNEGNEGTLKNTDFAVVVRIGQRPLST
jgi:hypothetical protein